MELAFYGAAGTVTGSSFLVRAGGRRVLVDCGLFQGLPEIEDRNRQPLPFDAGNLDYLLLTHAHIDHSGRIPCLARAGFRGRILATPATVDLCSVMLLDSAHIQEAEAEWHNRKLRRAGKDEEAPLYTIAEAQQSLRLFDPIPYEQVIDLGGGVTCRFRDAGHVLGSAFIEIEAEEYGRRCRLLFSGDLGNPGRPIIADPSLPERADYLVLESTYGNRLHQDEGNPVTALEQIVLDSLARGGNLIIPAFSVGRTQELIYVLNTLVEARRIPVLPVYIDSPLAVAATEITRRHAECYDSETGSLLARGDDPFSFPGLKFTLSTDESRALNDIRGGAIIISASGMCQAGRIKHHLKHNLWRPESSVLFVGYQAEGTLGRAIKDGARSVKIFGEEIAVRSRVYSLEALSAHADRDGLVAWAAAMRVPPAHTYLVHGEPESSTALAGTLQRRLGWSVSVARDGETVELSPRMKERVISG